ncbi:MAG TPA: nitroreductase [Natronosporangium sp.]
MPERGRFVAWWLGPGGQPGPVLRQCLRAATLAPSVMNTQPWLFQPRPDGVNVFADRRRQLTIMDPAGRELALSLGAALCNLRVAILAHGRQPAVLLLPRPSEPDLMARVQVGPPVAVRHTVRALAAAIARRRSNRWPFAPVGIPYEVERALVASARAEGALLRVLPHRARRRQLELAQIADEQWRGDPWYRHELGLWTRELPNRVDGVTGGAAGPRVAAGGPPLRDLGLVFSSGRRTEEVFERSPTIAVLCAQDGPEHWLRAGQALERVLLTATVYGLACTLMTQPLELPQLRPLAADPYSGLPAQAVIRLGYPRRPAAPSPRRPLASVLYQPADRAPTSIGDRAW